MTQNKSETIESLQNASYFAYVTNVLLGIVSIALAWQAAQARMQLNRLTGNEDLDQWINQNHSLDDMSVWVTFLFVIVTVSLAVWSYQLHTFSNSGTEEHPEWSRGWTIGGWITPLGQFIIPYLVIRESLLKLDRESKTHQIASAWWTLSLAGFALKLFANASTDIDTFYVLTILCAAALLLASVFAIYMVQDCYSIANLNSENTDRSVIQNNDAPPSSKNISRPETTTATDTQNRLETIELLRSQKLITETEFETKRQEILDRI
jgi:hypothetical protein